MPDEVQTTRIVGREAELARIRAVLARARSAATACKVCGRSGLPPTASRQQSARVGAEQPCHGPLSAVTRSPGRSVRTWRSATFRLPASSEVS